MQYQSLLNIAINMVTLDLLLRIKAELFTAITDIEPLLDSQKGIIDDLDEYIAEEEERLAVLKKHLSRFKKEHHMAMEDIPNYLGNPLNAFTLIKRLTTDLDFIEKNIMDGAADNKDTSIKRTDALYPTLEDLVGSILALSRLQDTYHLDIEDLSEGILNGINSSSPLSADDCYELGKTLYDEQSYSKSLLWFIESLHKLQNEDDLKDIQETDIIEYIISSYYISGDVQNALDWANILWILDPDYISIRDDVRKVQKAIQEKGDFINNQSMLKSDDEGRDDNRSSDWSSELDEIMVTYEALCRGDIDISSEIKKKLKCSYMTKNHPFLKLAPIKMEQMFLNPDVILFHQVMNDEEIEHIKFMAKPNMKRAEVNDPLSGKSKPASFRISKSSWLTDEESPVVARVSQRVADFTGLNMDFAEHLQVVNYGIGGHYVPHFDYYTEEESVLLPSTGQRIATVLFYMSDVTQGGATVFPKLNLSVFPVKNSAVFWMNLHHTGEGNTVTRHAACPVLLGSKWASNKWIPQAGQELIKPCHLEP